MKCEILTVLSFMMLVPMVTASCLTQEQTSALQNVSLSLNMTGDVLVSAFETQCNRTDNLTSSLNSSNQSVTLLLSQLNGSFTNYSTITDTKLGYLVLNVSNLNDTMTSNMTGIFAATNINAVSVANATVSQFGNLLLQYQDTVDDRIQNYKESFVTQEQFNSTMQNQSSVLDDKLSLWETYVSENYSTTRQFWMWLFFGMVVLSGAMVYLIRYHPEKASFITGIRPVRRSVFEITTPSEFKSKIGRVRELKLEIAGMKIPFEEKQVLMNKVDKDEIKDEDELESESRILEGLRKPKKDGVDRRQVKGKRNHGR